MPKLNSNRLRTQNSSRLREQRQDGGRSREALVASKNRKRAIRMKYGV